MIKKALIIVALLTIGATGLLADDWVGTFWGDDSGEWQGTISTSQDPILFRGEWVNEEGDQGTLSARGEIVGNFYVFEEGNILNADGEVIGHWSGEFPIYDDAYVTGPWWTEAGGGEWGGYRP